MPAIPPFIREPLWDQFAALLPQPQAIHPLGCHRPRIPDQAVFDKLLQVLVFGCGYRRIADATCSATTIRRRRDEWATRPMRRACRAGTAASTSGTVTSRAACSEGSSATTTGTWRRPTSIQPPDRSRSPRTERKRPAASTPLAAWSCVGELTGGDGSGVLRARRRAA